MTRGDSPLKVVLDVDPGVDDALAIILANNLPQIGLCAITTVCGNVHVERAWQNAGLVMSVVNGTAADGIPIAKGAAEPLARPFVGARDIHGEDGLGNATSLSGPSGPKYSYPDLKSNGVPAFEEILKAVAADPYQVTVVATGPLTNVATALMYGLETMRQVREIVIMGGAYHVEGNVGDKAEFNFWSDPDAARLVLGSGLPIRCVGLDVTRQVILPAEVIEKDLPKNGSRLGQFVTDICSGYVDFHRKVRGIDGCYLHDPLAVAVAAFPDLVETDMESVTVECAEGSRRGEVVRIRDWAPNARVATSVDVDRFLKLFLTHVC